MIRSLRFLCGLRPAFVAWLALWVLVGGADRAAADPVVVMTGPNTSEYNVVREIAAKWNDLHPETPVEVQMAAGSEDVLKVAILGGQPPDLYTAMASGPYVGMARDGLLLALNTLSGFDSLVARRALEPVIGMYTFAGQNFVLPWQAEILMYEYNVDLLEQIGVGEFPGRYSQFLDVCDKLFPMRKGCIELHLSTAWHERIADFYLHYLAASGGRTLIERRRAGFNNPIGLAVMEFLVDAHRRSYQSEAPGDLFNQGEVLTKRWGQAGIPIFNDAGLNWDVASPPVPDDYSGPEPPYTFMNMKHIVIPYNAKNPEGAWAFLQFMVEDENDRILLGSGRFPPRADLGTNDAFSDWFRTYPQGMTFALNIGHAHDLDQIPNLVEVFGEISKYFIAAVNQEMSPQSALEQAADAVNRLLF